MHGSERQAKKELALFVAEVEGKQSLLTESSTLAVFVERWLLDYAEPHLSARGVQRYKELLARVLDAMGHLKLAQITPLHIIKFYTNLRADGVRKDGKPGGLSQETIKHHHTVIKKMLNDAVNWGLLVTNPALKVKLPKRRKQEVVFYNEEETGKLLVALEHEEIQFQLMVQLAIVTGCRRAEIIALQWSDIDFKNNEIEVKRAISVITGQKQETKAPKSGRFRRLTIPESIAKALKKYKKQQSKERIKRGLGKSIWLFTGRSGELMHLDTSGKQFARFIKKNKLAPITLHGLRHTHGTTLIAAGLDIQTVAHRLGHSETSTTLDIYTHLLKSADQAAADVMEQILVKNKIKQTSSEFKPPKNTFL